MQLKHISGAGDVVSILCGIRFPSRMPRSGVNDAESCKQHSDIGRSRC
jgi:hypothetical protein